ncbi:restriction endonuclease subunit S [Calothrix sp. PCC 6303]|uniref:restriction endonuclease subunit S n=1 Tax=Calothrix sp. PCC 6303 TaxID=1170562 RepID=UPI0002A01113|nr:restriction endonuclease subunit S [Calothrix sp. PCC 6303]AFZ00429.1 restriction modification system DNA specificity domain protein [Calothrix sp. PCC 6303]
MGEELYELPKGWAYSELRDVAEIIMGQSPPGDSYNQDGIGVPLINGPVEFGPRPFSKTIRSKFTTQPTRMCKKDDLILCVRGSTTGRINIAGFDASIGRGVAAIRSLLYQEYLNIFIHAIREQIYNRGTGSTFPNVSNEAVSSIIVPLPPLPEQHRIVAKIEELFTQLDTGVELLKKVKAKLKRYRQAVLKAAVEGNLTKEWREANQGELEPASVLLERILKQRREKWEAEQLAKMKAQGKTPKDDSWKLKYQEPVAPDTSELRELPDEWVWTTLELVANAVDPQPSHRTPPTVDGGVPYIGMGDIKDGKIDFENSRKVSIEVLKEHQGTSKE